MSRNWAQNSKLLIDLSKAIEKRMWPYENPLAQITTLQRETVHNLNRWADDYDPTQLREMEPKDIGDLIHLNEKHGLAVRDAARILPTVELSYQLQPLSHDLLQVRVNVKPTFTWNAKLSGQSEPIYVWLQDAEGSAILQWRSVLLRPSTTSLDIDFVVTVAVKPEAFELVGASDRWFGGDETMVIPLHALVMPPEREDQTELLDIPFLHISALDDAELEKAYRPFITSLNGIQTQVFWSVYHTQHNVVVSAPVNSGKTFLGEMAVWWVCGTLDR